MNYKLSDPVRLQVTVYQLQLMIETMQSSNVPKDKEGDVYALVTKLRTSLTNATT